MATLRGTTRAKHEARPRGAKPGIVYLCTLRRQARLTQQQLAVLSGVSQPAISRLELHNVGRVARDTVLKLASALHVDPMLLRFGPNPHVQLRRRSVWRDDRPPPEGEAPAADAAGGGGNKKAPRPRPPTRC